MVDAKPFHDFAGTRRERERPRSSLDDTGGSPRSAPESSFTHHALQDGPEIVVGSHEDLPDGVGEESLEPMSRDELLASSARTLALGP